MAALRPAVIRPERVLRARLALAAVGLEVAGSGEFMGLKLEA
jgi:hypothetical protein